MMNSQNLDRRLLRAAALLFNAAENNNFRHLQLACQLGTDVSIQDHFQRTALHWFAWHGNEAAMNFLLERGADPNLRNWVGWTPLFCAIYREQVNAVRKLVELTDINIASSINYFYEGPSCPPGSTVIDIARIIDNEEIIQLINSVSINIRPLR